MIRAPAPMCRCSKIMHMMRDLHPTLLSALEGIVDQVRYNKYFHDIIIFINLSSTLNYLLVEIYPLGWQPSERYSQQHA